ncbi:hypothetical protein M3Y94_00413600 [Aphelenchoides besseyi]|nr:hypothetical protein M3Y94_00413600 [Aphelenchoides besseyi]KAI6229633.1 NAD-dependent protein deacetylase sir-2.1 [Aphelenchoides besseyi]
MEAELSSVAMKEDEVLQIKAAKNDVIVSDSEAQNSNDSDELNDDSELELLNDSDEFDDREERLSQKWKKPQVSGVSIVQQMLGKGLTPRQMLQTIVGPECPIPDNMPEHAALRYFIQIATERRHRDRLPQFNDFVHAVQLFKEAKRILIITGAGVSVSCGIPDFRSSTGVYASLRQTYPDLPHPSSMFEIEYFKRRPEVFFSFAKEIFPGVYKPSISHLFIRFLEMEEKLLRNYTQNIDTLERVAGIERRVECHGSFGTGTCLQCGQKYTCDEMREDIYAQQVVRCKSCGDGICKPDIVFFGEDLPDSFHNQMAEDRDQVDLLVVIGSSLQVQPVSLIPYNVDETVPQILINKENIPSYDADVKLLGDCDQILTALCCALGGRMQELMLNEIRSRPALENKFAGLKLLLKETPTELFPKCISQNEVLELVAGKEANDEETAKIDEEETEASSAIERLDCDIPTKRLRLTVESKTTEDSATTSTEVNATIEDTGQNDMSSLWENNYVHIPSVFNGHMYAKFLPNLNIFSGADFYYDRDRKTFGPLPKQQDSPPTSPEPDDGINSSTASSPYCGSAPDLPNQPFVALSPNEKTLPSSCPSLCNSNDSSSSFDMP